MRRLSQREVRPIDNCDESIRLILLILQQFLQGQQHGPVDGHQRVQARVPIGGEKQQDLPAPSITILQNSRVAVSQRHLN